MSDLHEMHERVTAAILPAFDHIKDEKYRHTIAACWARAAIGAMKLLSPDVIEAGRDRPFISADFNTSHCWYRMIDRILASRVDVRGTREP